MEQKLSRAEIKWSKNRVEEKSSLGKIVHARDETRNSKVSTDPFEAPQAAAVKFIGYPRSPASRGFTSLALVNSATRVSQKFASQHLGRGEAADSGGCGDEGVGDSTHFRETRYPRRSRVFSRFRGSTIRLNLRSRDSAPHAGNPPREPRTLLLRVSLLISAPGISTS